MNKKLGLIISCITAFTLICPITSLAGSWQAVESNWMYQNNDGSYVKDSWLTENDSHYYFDSNGIMLKNTLSPDGYPLGRDGKWIINTENLPSAFWGNESAYAAYFYDVMNFCDGYNKIFNNTFDEGLTIILHIYSTQDFDSAQIALNNIDSFDFTTYMNSENAVIRKLATVNEIFRIEQVYYMSAVIEAARQKNYDGFSILCDKLLLSVNKYADDTITILDQLAAWDIY